MGEIIVFTNIFKMDADTISKCCKTKMQQNEECAIFDEKRELIYFGYGHVFMIMVAT